MSAERILQLSIGILLSFSFMESAGAHEVLEPRTDVLKLRPTGIRLEQRYDIGPGLFAGELRTRHDRDHDLRLDVAERDALQGWLEGVTATFVRLEIGGQRQEMKTLERRAGPLEVVLPSERGISFLRTVELPWPQGTTPWKLTFRDRFKDAAVPLGLRLRLEPPCTLEVGALVQLQSDGSRRETPIDPGLLRVQRRGWTDLTLRADEVLELVVVCPAERR